MKKLITLVALSVGVFILAGTLKTSAHKADLTNLDTEPFISVSNSISKTDISIKGAGFEPYEVINFQVVRDGDSGALIAAEWVGVADTKGSLNESWQAEADAQYIIRAVSDSKKTAEAGFDTNLAPGSDIDQCKNGGIGDPAVPCSGANWVNGNLNSNQAHYLEGQSVPYRMKLSDLTVGNSYTVTIGYDTTQGGKHALDYLTSYDRTETVAMGNDPCSSVAGCALGDPDNSTFAIPLDPNVSSAGVTQIGGQSFTLFNGTITAVSGYTLNGSYAGNSDTTIAVTFTAAAANPVLAWGGHIATRADWGANNSAIAISGSPYHMRQDSCSFGCGSQDRALTSAAVIFPGSITVILNAIPDTGLDVNYTTGGPFLAASLAPFTLDDDGGGDATYSNTAAFTGLTNFGVANTYTVTEAPLTFPWALSSLVCVEDPQGGGGLPNSTTSVPLATSTLILEEGEAITCTYTIAAVTAGVASVGGRVQDTFGNGIGGADVTLMSAGTGQIFAVRTNQFGKFIFTDVPVGEFYVMSVNSKRYAFNESTQSFLLVDDLEGMIFTASP